ncbi:hypothetical protein ANN_03447 [Periplaneta americana]|uniref:Uncharacterized protein n=1 Tax=Periplaneta americana TaxID=6978 RepID=A0ABQ8TZ37_PERAM|nr:hypothetical protein ANN_03447 [Periplaneta americana]
MAGLCEGGNEPSGSLKAICGTPTRDPDSPGYIPRLYVSPNLSDRHRQREEYRVTARYKRRKHRHENEMVDNFESKVRLFHKSQRYNCFIKCRGNAALQACPEAKSGSPTTGLPNDKAGGVIVCIIVLLIFLPLSLPPPPPPPPPPPLPAAAALRFIILPSCHTHVFTCTCKMNSEKEDHVLIVYSVNQIIEKHVPPFMAFVDFEKAFDKVVVITEDVQNVHLLLEYTPHIDVSLTCEHDPKLQEYCVCPQNMPQFDSEGIPNQAPETNKPMILNDPTSRNREGSDQVSVEAKQLGHLYLSIDQETFDPSTGEP